MRIIGLTGSIACGKSTVAAVLRDMGAAIIDGDQLSHQVTAPGGCDLPAIRQTFGDKVFHPDGTLDRRALGALVFGDDAAREKLNAIVHPLVIDMTRQQIHQARQAGAEVCVLDVPLLFETGMDALCHRVWCVWLPQEVQLQRLMARDGFTREEALARLRSQLSADEKAARAEIVIDTSGSMDYTKAMLPALFAQELALAHEKETPYASTHPSTPAESQG